MPFGEATADDAWLAALFLGEGTLSINKRNVQIMFSNTDLAILKQAAAIYGEPSSTRIISDSRPRAGNWRISYLLWVRGGREAKMRLLRRMRPFMVGRKADATDIILRYLELRRPKDKKKHWDHHHTAEELQLLSQAHQIYRKGR